MATKKIQDLTSLGALATSDKLVGERVDGTTVRFTYSEAGTTNFTTAGTITTGTWNASTIAVGYGGSGRATATAYAILAGGTTATGAHQSLSTGSSGQILQSAGASAVPAWSTATYPTTASTSGKRLKSDGTNLVMSTTTMPDSGTSGKIIRGDGTNYVESTSTFADTYASQSILYASSANTVAALATANSSMLVTDGSGNLSYVAFTGSGAPVRATSPTLVTPALGTPSSGNLSSCTAYAQSALTGLGTGVSTFLGTPSSANLASAITDETGTGALVFANTPTLVTPVLGAATATSINFGGSTLSSYVTGTFTPTVTLVGGAGNTVPQYTTNSGRYTQIGNIVFVRIYLGGDGGNEGAGSGQVNIALPIAVSASAATAPPINAGGSTNNTNFYTLIGTLTPSATTIPLFYRDAATTTATFTGAQQNNASRDISLSFFYEV